MLRIDIHHHIHVDSGMTIPEYRAIVALLHGIDTKVGSLMTTQAELAAQLNTIGEQVTKIGTETQGLKDKVAELETAIQNGGNVTQEVQDALDAVKSKLQSVDDLVTDAAPTPPAGDATTPA